MVDALAIRDTGFILVPASWPYVQQIERELCIARHQGVLVEGGYKQDGREGESLRSLGDDDALVVCCVFRVACLVLPFFSPCDEGTFLPL